MPNKELDAVISKGRKGLRS